MAKQKVAERAVEKSNPNMMMVISYVTVTVVSAVVIYLANMLFPDHIVLGTMSISMMWAVMLSAGKLGLITTLAMPFFTEFEIQRKKILSPMEFLIGFFVVNFAGLWFITRFAEIFGLGVSSWMVLIALAAVVDFAQGMAMMVVPKLFSK
jgi:hypothetical protein